MKIEMLHWDSDFFQIKIGRLLLSSEITFDYNLFEREAIAENYDLIYIFSMQKILQKENHNALELVDIQLTMSKPFYKENYINEPYELKTSLSEFEKIECYKIVEETSVYSRFYHEKLIGPEKTKKLYRKWIDNSLNRVFCDGLFITKKSDLIIGIHSIKTDIKNNTGICSLIGVNEKHRGLKLGFDLWQQANGYWANETDIKKTKVPFSLNNVGSFNFHLKMGFNKVEEIKYIYHYRKIT